jgi:alkenylglycerophosphocholine/alkenylglycerophosphoethanolamine hydrolase
LSLWIVAKPLPVLVLAVWLVARTPSRYATWIAIGLVLSAVGDVLLEMGEAQFVFGMAAFAVAHAFYIAAFVGRSPALHLLLACPFAVWGVGLFARLRPGLGSMTLPVGVYAVLLMVMAWRAAGCIGARGTPTPGEWAAACGAVLFALSDSLIAVDRFDGPIPAWARLAILPLYWLGQSGIAWSARAYS